MPSLGICASIAKITIPMMGVKVVINPRKLTINPTNLELIVRMYSMKELGIKKESALSLSKRGTAQILARNSCSALLDILADTLEV